MYRTISAAAVVALVASGAISTAASADSTPAKTVNTVGYFTPDGTRGTVNLADTSGAAVVPGGTSPLVVSLGDSYISGEAGRWAGNVMAVGAYDRADALGTDAYDDVPGAEAIDGCHRSRQAEVNFSGSGATSVNLACSGATTMSVSGSEWKPGIDFAATPLRNGATGYGQAQLLKNLVAANPGRVRMVLLSIGGNDFDFGTIVKSCAKAFISGRTPCSKNRAVTDKVADKNVATQRAAIAAAIDRVIQAVGSNNNQPWTLVVQDYPSPIATRDTIRYGQNTWRWYLGGCPMYDKDLDWANREALQRINDTVQAAVNLQRQAHPEVAIEFLELQDAMKGHRLCEQNVYPLDLPGGPVRKWTQTGAVDTAEWIQEIRIAGALSRDIAIWPFQTQESLHPNYWAQLAYQNCLSQVYGTGRSITGGWCVYAGPGLNAKGRPNMTLLTQPMRVKKVGQVTSVKASTAGAHRVKVTWRKPAKATAETRYEYRVKVGSTWGGWLSAGTSRAVIVSTPTKKAYTVKVRVFGNAVKKTDATVRFAGRR